MVGSAFSTVLDSGRRPQHSATKNHDTTIRVCRERYRGPSIGRQGTPQPSGKGSATGLLSGDLERLRLSRKHVFFPYEGGDWDALKNRENQHNSLHFLSKNEFSPI